MGARGRLRVAVIYSHPLLGEGIGQMLAAEPDLDVSEAPCSDAARTATLVESGLDVIILERNCTVDSTEILRRSPDTLVIEMGLHPGATWAYRRQEIPNRPDAILAVVRRLRGGHPVVVASGESSEPDGSDGTGRALASPPVAAAGRATGGSPGS